MNVGDCRKNASGTSFILIHDCKGMYVSYWKVNLVNNNVTKTEEWSVEHVLRNYPNPTLEEEFIEAYKQVINHQIEAIESLLSL